MTDLLKEIKTLREKAAKYDHLKGRYDTYDEKLKAIIDQINELRKEMNPTGMIRKSNNAERNNYDEILKEAFNAMTMGLEVDREFLEKRGIEYARVTYLLKRLREMSGVDQRKEGTKVKLFLRKEV